MLSLAYLRSPYCMTELAGIWREARRWYRTMRRSATSSNGSRTPGTGSRSTTRSRRCCASTASCLIGERDFAQFRLIGDFYGQVNQLLSDINDVLSPRHPVALRADNFAVVRGMIDQALAPDPGAIAGIQPQDPTA